MSIKHAIDWTIDDVGNWLNSIGYQDLVDDFKVFKIDGPKLVTLEDKDLSKIDFKGTKKNFNVFLNELKSQSAETFNGNNRNVKKTPLYNNFNYNGQNRKGNKGKNIIQPSSVHDDDFYSLVTGSNPSKKNDDFIFGSQNPYGKSSLITSIQQKENEKKLNDSLGAFEFNAAPAQPPTRGGRGGSRGRGGGRGGRTSNNNNNNNNNNNSSVDNHTFVYENVPFNYNNYKNEIKENNMELMGQIKTLRELKEYITKKTIVARIKEFQNSLPDIFNKTNLPDEVIQIILQIFSNKYVLDNLPYQFLYELFEKMMTSSFFQHPSNLDSYLQLNQADEDLFISLRRIFNKIIDLFDIDCVVFIRDLMFKLQKYYRENFSLDKEQYQKNKQQMVNKQQQQTNNSNTNSKEEEQPNNAKRDDNFNKLFQLFKSKEEEYEKPKDFRKLPILPEPGELKSVNKHLKPTKLGEYESEYEYLETHFRLIREDLINPIRTSIDSFRRGESSSNLYYNVRFKSITTSTISLGYEVTFDSMHEFSWETYPKLIVGSLVALSCDNFQNIHYMVVSNREEFGRLKRISLSPYIDANIYNTTSTVPSPKDKKPLFSYFKTEFFENIYVMIESPSFFIAYQHILLSLQQIEDDLLPFKDTLVKCNNRDTREPPKYIRDHPSFDFSRVFREKVIIDGKDGASCNVIENFPQELDSLDESQMKAIKQTLTSSLSLILGPPGTGKSFVSRNLFHLIFNNIKEQLGGLDMAPILVLSHTNHALDQFTNHLLQITDKAVRIGTRSKDETIKKIQMNNKLKGSTPLSIGFKKRLELIRLIKEAFDKLQEPFEYSDLQYLDCDIDLLKIFPNEYDFVQFLQPIRREIDTQILMDLRKDYDYEGVYEHQKSVDKYISKGKIEPDELKVDRSIVKQKMKERKIDGFYGLIDTDVDGFGDENNGDNRDCHSSKKKTIGRIGGFIRFLKFNYGSRISKNNPKEQVLSFSSNKRVEFYRYLMKLKIEKLINDIENHFRHFQIQTNIIEEDQFKVRKNLLEKDTELIAATITGASRFKKLFETLNIKVVMIEECALSMEGFITAVIPSTVEHLILVGDHNQLKPSCTDHSLLTKFEMDRSIFERIYSNGGRCSTLTTQRRMSSTISRFILPVYKDLQNHYTVEERDAKLKEEQQQIIKGCLFNVFFFDHIQNETKAMEPNLNSKSNYFEAEMVIHFALYLLNQGYRSEQITILTPYSGQLLLLNEVVEGLKSSHHITKDIKDQLINLDICTVDQYQGEENDIILVSLVRNNKDNIGGFLGITNRINVMISRARLGLYLFGNQYLLQHMRSNEQIWKNMFPLLEEEGQVGVSLPLTCPNHPNTITFVKSKKDFFQYSPDGGCHKNCSTILKCGHQCKRKCHPDPNQHLCKMPCPNILKCGHQCQRFCGQRCGECQILTFKTHPKCRHKIKVKCSDHINDVQCPNKCDRISNSKKQCKNLCGQPCRF